VGGVLILVAGPSGAGKDTLIDAARCDPAFEARFVFARRIITRCESIGENHIAVSADAFEAMRERGAFLLHWKAHGLQYGLPAELLVDLNAGRCVIANVSRRVVEQARALWPQTEVIEVAVDPAVLRERLVARGREPPEEIEARVRRARDPACTVPPPVHIVDNSRGLEESIAHFKHLLVALTEPASLLAPAH
jgi:phosphonate metabolism protein PhnN/1,5-bisphosphokinase (PRPP-forming)